MLWTKAPFAFAITSFKKGGGLIFEGGPIFERLWYIYLHNTLYMQVTCIPVYVEFLVEYCSEVLVCTLNRILGSSKDDGCLIMKKVCLQVGAVKLVKQAWSCLWTNRHQPVPLLRLECHCRLFKVVNNLIAKP